MKDNNESTDILKSVVVLVNEDIKQERSRTDLVVICSDETFISLKTGTISPEFAFMMQLLKLKGSAGTGLKFFKFYLSEVAINGK